MKKVLHNCLSLLLIGALLLSAMPVGAVGSDDETNRISTGTNSTITVSASEDETALLPMSQGTSGAQVLYSWVASDLATDNTVFTSNLTGDTDALLRWNESGVLYTQRDAQQKVIHTFLNEAVGSGDSAYGLPYVGETAVENLKVDLYPLVTTTDMRAVGLSFVYAYKPSDNGLNPANSGLLRIYVSEDGETWSEDYVSVRSTRVLGSGVTQSGEEVIYYRIYSENLLSISGLYSGDDIQILRIMPDGETGVAAGSFSLCELTLFGYGMVADFEAAVHADFSPALDTDSCRSAMVTAALNSDAGDELGVIKDAFSVVSRVEPASIPDMLTNTVGLHLMDGIATQATEDVEEVFAWMYEFDLMSTEIGEQKLAAYETITTTQDIVQDLNTPQQIFQGYAACKPGDVLVQVTETASHAYMVTKCAPVYLPDTVSVDPNQSTLTYWNLSKQVTVTFFNLYSQGTFVPVTLDVLADDAVQPVRVDAHVSIADGVRVAVASNWDIASYSISMDGFEDTVNQPGAADIYTNAELDALVETLEPGKYQMTVDVVADSQLAQPDPVVLEFEILAEQYLVSVGETTNGTISVSPTSGPVGASVVVTAKPAEGYELREILVDGVAIVGNTFTISKDHVVTANFDRIAYSVTVGAVENGTVTVNPASGVAGTTVTVTATPNQGYALKEILVDGEAIEGNTFTISKSHTVTATFEESDYSVTVGTVANGTVTVNPVSGAAGTTVTVTATPAAGYKLVEILVDGKAISGNTFTISGNHTVTATFAAVTYSVAVGEVENGTVTVNHASGAVGTTVTVTATPAAGYKLVEILVDGTAIEGNTFTISGEHVVTATFEQIIYGVMVGEVSNGTVSVEPVSGALGAAVTVTATPNEGYRLVAILVDGKAIEGNTFTISGEHVVTATFEQIIYGVTVGEVSNGTVSVDPVSGAAGTTVTVTATPAADHELKEILVDGVAIEGNTFTISGNHTVTASFEKIAYSVSVGAVENGTVTVNPPSGVVGTVVTVTATPADGYQLVEILVDGAAIEGNTFTISKSHTVTASFEEEVEVLSGSIRLRSAALGLKDMVSVQYKASDDLIATNDEDVAERGVLLFDSAEKAAAKNVADAVEIVPLEWNEQEQRYVGETEGISARKMGDSRFAVAYLKMVDGTYIFGSKNGEVQAPIEYSPRIYCQNMVSNAGTSSTVKSLCRALMYYGAAAQAAQDGQTTGLMSEGFEAITYDETVLGETVFYTNTAVTNGMKLRSAALELKGAISYIVKYTKEDTSLTNTQLYAEYTLLGENGSVELEPGSDGRLWATISGISARNMGATLTVKPYYLGANGEKVYGGELVYSGYEYVRRGLANTSYNEANKELCRALAMYFHYADAYGNG